MNLQELTTLVRTEMAKVDKGGVPEAMAARDAFKAAGITANMHLGQPQAFFVDRLHVVEWYAGSVVDVVDSEAYYCINSLINTLDKFCPALEGIS